MIDHHPPQPRVIVTGSSGLIGSAVIERMAERYQMIGFDRAGAPYPPPEAESVSVDLTSDESLARGLARVRHAYGDRLASVIHYELDVSRASMLLGWRSTHWVMQTLPRMVSALLEDPAAWYRLHGMTLPSSIEARAHALAGERR